MEDHMIDDGDPNEFSEEEFYEGDEPDEDDERCPGCGAAFDEECDMECEYYEL